MNEEEKEVIKKLKFQFLSYNIKEYTILLNYINKLEIDVSLLQINNRNLLNAYNDKVKEVLNLEQELETWKETYKNEMY